MKVLLDECLPKELIRHLKGHSCKTVNQANWSGKSNGELLTLAINGGYDAFLTVDQGIPFEIRTQSVKIPVIIMRPNSNRLSDILPFVGKVLTMLSQKLTPQFYTIDAP